MGFQQGLSGLKAASTSLDVIGNNVANASTVGFKQGQAQFSDIYSMTMHTAASNQVGIGVSVMRVQQQFTQGNVTPSANSLDLAINGNGFFRFQDELGSVLYSRNGQLELTKEGYLVNGANHKLTGFPVDPNTGLVASGAATVIQLSTEYIEPKITSQVTSLLNFDSREDVIDQTTHPFDVNDPLSYNDATAIDVYDSLGNMHVLQTFYVRTTDTMPSTWAVYAYADGLYIGDTAGVADPNPGVVNPIGYLRFNDYGQPQDAYASDGSTLLPGFQLSVEIPAMAGAADFDFTIDYTGTTQYGSNFAVNDNQQDGYASGRLTGFTVDPYGNVLGRYSNGEAKVLAQVCLVAFRNPNGLNPVGDNEWVETLESGAPIIGSPLTASLGQINDYSIEESNVDLTEELVDMIVAQRVYQANAQTIKTQDAILQTLVSMR
ncbi:flagellar hook protein FlgE [Oxalobacter vibrioformis]|uniref:Flagellar hook protein FlgE n=1 Tax=Oxalobacter vibrioformis TaxID=933080 RepID=A0A9E9LVK5_9BURK|nr:flagellar hook protein FlgE [Oxalobacter vibrioformis]WAW09527.1 flagellar hook protein FlgE [Oxalobacter vibrioformis]